MNEIEHLDLKSFVAHAVSEVFSTMLSLEVEPDVLNGQSPPEGNRIVGSVSFAGEVMGSISIQVTDAFGRLIAAAMLGMEEAEIEGTDEVNDVIGEMSNMIGGGLKSHLCDSGFPCDLSIPSITTGSDFKIESRSWLRHEKFAFKCNRHIAVVEAFIKPGS